MRIVIAPDSFKESLGASEAAQAMAQGVRDALPAAEIICVPMADGGEGSLQAVLACASGERRCANTVDANNQACTADWAWLGEGKAFIEIAAAVGLAQIPAQQRNVLKASSFGVGPLILAALDAGATHITLGLGGSACNDAGAGMLQALGFGLLDERGKPIGLGGEELARLHAILPDKADPRLARTVFEAAIDVDSPLCSPQGASLVFGPQKGASRSDAARLDAALNHFADVCANIVGTDHRRAPGAGAAGGLGFGARAFLQAAFRPGADLMAELAGLDRAMDGASLVLTGEGRLDGQTLRGKTAAGVARHARMRQLPVIAIAGELGDGYEALYDIGITAAFSAAPGPISLEQACAQAALQLRRRTNACIRLWAAGFNRLDH